MKRSKFLVLAGIAALVPLQAARAQTNYCYPGQLWTCFSYQLSAVPSGTGTNVTLKVRNTSVASPGGQTSWLTTLGFYAPSNIGTPSNLLVTAGSGVQVVGTNPGSYWHLTTSNGLGLPMALDKFATGSNPKQGDISGCGTEGGATIYFKTCAPSYQGFVIFTFHTTGNWASSVEYASIAARWQTSQGSFDCSSKPQNFTTSVRTCTGIAVVPEPVSMLLLGSGLLGVGGLMFVRRRKENGDIESA